MQYVAYVFAIFGFLAYLEMSSLKRRVGVLEEQLAKTKGTPLFENRRALVQAARAYIGKQVSLELKEDHEDADVVMYGNSKHGANTILDADEEWILVRIDTPKGTKEKLLRLESIKRISVGTEG